MPTNLVTQPVVRTWHDTGPRPGWYAQLACGCTTQLHHWLTTPRRLHCPHHVGRTPPQAIPGGAPHVH